MLQKKNHCTLTLPKAALGFFKSSMSKEVQLYKPNLRECWRFTMIFFTKSTTWVGWIFVTAFCPVPELPHPLNSLTGQDSLWPSANWNTSQQYYLHFVVHAVSLSSNPDLPRHERHTELMASGGRQPARVLGTCWPQLWLGHTAAGGKRATLVPSFPPLSLSLHLPPLLSEHQSKSRRIRPKRYFEGLEIYIG